MASLTFDEEYKAERIRQRGSSSSSVTNVAKAGTNLFGVNFTLIVILVSILCI